METFIIKGYELGLLSKKEKYFELIQFLDNAFNIKIASEKKVNIEDILTYLEIEIERNPTPELLKYKEQLLSLISDILQLLAEKIIEGEYIRFKTHLVSASTILTFNWDLLLDDVFDRINVIQFKFQNPVVDSKTVRPHYFNSFMEITAYGEMTLARGTPESPYNLWDGHKSYFLKLHGSIDWRYCINEGCRAFRKVYPVIDSLGNYFCSECHESMRTLIIPPVLNKNYMNYPTIRKIWNIAVKEIKLANEIIIWGYNLPATDFYSQWLLRKASPKNLKKVIIINPKAWGEKTQAPYKTFRRRFLDIFKNYEEVDFNFYKSFQEYLTAENKESAGNL